MYRLLFFIVCVTFLGDAKHLPSYIKACKRSDPNRRTCVKENAIAALPGVIKGDKDFKSPSLSPFKIQEVTLNPSDRLSLKLKDVLLRGLENAVIEDIDFNLEKQHFYLKLSFPWTIIEGTYEIDGRILLLPIQGTGPANISNTNMIVEFSFDYALEKHNDGRTYMDSNVKPDVKYSIGGSHFYFGNLFNGDKTLGDRTNEFLNEHAEELHQDISSPISEIINSVATSVIKKILPQVPLDEIFV